MIKLSKVIHESLRQHLGMSACYEIIGKWESGTTNQKFKELFKLVRKELEQEEKEINESIQPDKRGMEIRVW